MSLVLTMSKRDGDKTIVLHQNGNVICTIDCLNVRGNQVQVGLTAPSYVEIDRQKVFDRKQTEKAA